MISKNLLFLFLLLSTFGSTQAISFMDYYKGNAALGIPSHEKQVNDAVESRRLFIPGVNLTDLDGIDTVPNIDQLLLLDLHDNQLEALPAGINKLKRLQDLRLHHNQFSVFPKVICELPDLEILDYEYNQLTSIPECIGGLIKLRNLFLGHNNLTLLPVSICKLSELTDLLFRENEIDELPDCFGQLVKLNRLVAAENQLTKVPFLGGTALRSVKLAENPLPFSNEQLYEELGLKPEVELTFKSQNREQEEHRLFGAIMAGDVEAVGQLYTKIKGFLNKSYPFESFVPILNPIDIAKIRDPYGNNLLHATIQRASEHLRQISKQMNALVQDESLTEKSKADRLEKLEHQKSEINDRYMKIFSILLNCRQKCVEDMLNTTNAQGETVIMAMLGKLGPDNPLFLAIEKVLLDEEKQIKEEKKIKAIQAQEEAEKERTFEEEKKIKAKQAEEARRKEQEVQTRRFASEHIQEEELKQIIEEHKRKQKEKEENASCETVAELLEQETAQHKQQLVDRLTELREVTDKNKLPQISKQIQQAINFVDEQPYTADVLKLTMEMLKQVNKATNIKYRNRSTKISDLLKPIISTMDRDIKILAR